MVIEVPFLAGKFSGHALRKAEGAIFLVTQAEADIVAQQFSLKLCRIGRLCAQLFCPTRQAEGSFLRELKPQCYLMVVPEICHQRLSSRFEFIGVCGNCTDTRVYRCIVGGVHFLAGEEKLRRILVLPTTTVMAVCVRVRTEVRDQAFCCTQFP